MFVHATDVKGNPLKKCDEVEFDYAIDPKKVKACAIDVTGGSGWPSKGRGRKEEGTVTEEGTNIIFLIFRFFKDIVIRLVIQTLKTYELEFAFASIIAKLRKCNLEKSKHRRGNSKKQTITEKGTVSSLWVCSPCTTGTPMDKEVPSEHWALSTNYLETAP